MGAGVLVVLGLLAATQGPGFAATLPSGFASGQVVSIKSDTFVVKNSFGSSASSTVSLNGASSITEQLTGTRADLKPGLCVTANGQKQSSDAPIAAMRITTTLAVKGKCSTGVFGSHGTPRSGTPPSGSSGTGRLTGFPGFGNFGFAAGTITAVKGSKVTIHGDTGSATVTLSTSTQILDMRSASRSAITVNACVSVRGSSTDNDLEIKATSVNVSKPGASGCTHGFRGGPS